MEYYRRPIVNSRVNRETVAYLLSTFSHWSTWYFLRIPLPNSSMSMGYVRPPYQHDWDSMARGAHTPCWLSMRL